MPSLADCHFPNMPEPWVSALREATAWILANLPVRAILVSGTPVRGNPDPASDLDFQIVIRESWGQRITRFFAGVPCEIFVNPRHRFGHWFTSEAKEGCPSCAHMVATAAVICDPEGLAPDLQAEARRHLDQPPHLDAPRLNRLRYGPATDIEDAQDVLSRDGDLASLCVAEALPAAIDAWFLLQGRTKPRRKDRLAALAALAPEAAALVRRCLGASTADERVDAGVAACRLLVGASGTFAWESLRQELPDPLPETGCFRRDLGGGLMLRETMEADAEVSFAIVERERERLARFLPWALTTRDAEDIRRFHRSQEAAIQAGTVRQMTICWHGALVGRISLRDIDRVVRTGDLGYWISADHEGRGLMTRVLGAVCEHAFRDLNLRRLTLQTHPDNHRSQALARRCGFQQEGVFRQPCKPHLIHGLTVQQVWFARLADDPGPGA